MPQTPPNVGETVTYPNGKKYIFEGVNEDGTWKLTPIGAAEGQSGMAGFGRTLAQGATFGFSDEIAGAIGAIGEGTYEESRDRARENLAQYRSEHPVLSMGAEAIGGLATGLAAPGLLAARAGGAGVRGALGIKRASDVAKTARAAELAGGLGKGGTLGSKALQAARLGATEGAVYGVGAGGEARGATLDESIKSRLGSGAMGGLLGVGLGAGMAGGLAGVGKAMDFGKAVKAGKVGTGGTQQIATTEASDIATRKVGVVDPKTGGLLTDEALVAPAGSAAVAADDLSAFALAKLEAQDKEFIGKAKAWVTKHEGLNSPEYKEYLKAGNSELYAGIMALADEAAKKEAKSGAVPALYADRSKRHRATATLAAGTTEGQQGALLGEAAAGRPNVAAKALDDVEPAFGERVFEAPGTARTAERLKTEASALAQLEYDAVYKLDKATRRRIHGDKTYQEVIERLTRSLGADGASIPEIGKALKRAQDAAVLAAQAAKDPVKAGKLTNRRFWSLLGDIDAKGNYRPPTKGALDRAGGPEALDVLRRTLVEVKEGMMTKNSGTTNMDMGFTLKKLIKDLDDAVGGVRGADGFNKARAGYSGRKAIREVYEDGPSIINRSPASIKAYVDKLKRDPIDVGSNSAGIGMKRSEYQIFKQSILDDFTDQIDTSDVGKSSAQIAELRDQFKKLFGGKKPILDASDADVERISRNLDELAKQADLSKRIANTPGMPASADLEGAVEATAFGYALAGQPGAAARTGMAGTIYGPQRWENIGGAMARRLRQTESEGLRNVAQNIAKTEGRKVSGRGGLVQRKLGIAGPMSLTGRTALAPAMSGLLGGQREDAEGAGGGRYRGYRPYEVRRQRLREELTGQQNRGGLLDNGGGAPPDGVTAPPVQPTPPPDAGLLGPVQPTPPVDSGFSVRTASNVIGGEPEKGEYELLLNDPGDYTENEIPRGVVNNNPMNLKDDGSPWQGWDKTSRDEDFIKFDNPEAGARAGMLNHLTHFERGDNTVDKLLERASPRSDNPDFDEYADYVAEQMGVDRDEQIDLEDENIGNAFALAVVDFELGAGEDPWGGALIAGLRSAYRAHRAKIARRSTTLAAAQ